MFARFLHRHCLEEVSPPTLLIFGFHLLRRRRRRHLVVDLSLVFFDPSPAGDHPEYDPELDSPSVWAVAEVVLH